MPAPWLSGFIFKRRHDSAAFGKIGKSYAGSDAERAHNTVANAAVLVIRARNTAARQPKYPD